MPRSAETKKKRILSEFATIVRRRRHELGMTQEQLAEKANFHVNYIGGIERAIKNPSLTSIIFLAEALDILPHELIPNP